MRVLARPERLPRRHDAVRLVVARHEEQPPEHDAEDDVDTQEGEEDGGEVGGEGPVDVEVEGDGGPVDVGVHLAAVPEVVDEVHVVTVEPVQDVAPLRARNGEGLKLGDVGKKDGMPPKSEHERGRSIFKGQ